MNAAHFHLLVNHVPIIGFGIGVILTLIGLWKRDEKGITTAVVLVLFISAIGSVLSLESGEGAEDLVEGLPGVTHEVIHEHEEMAETANIAGIITGIAALGLLFLAIRKQFETPIWAWVVVLALVLATTTLMAITGNAGGKIRHTEIRSEYTMPDEPADIATVQEQGEMEDQEQEHEANED